MSIPSAELWLASDDAIGSMTHLGSVTTAPDEFESMAAVKDYIRDHYDIGSYTILRKAETVEVTPDKVMFAEYTDEDMAALDTAVEVLADAPNTISATVAENPRRNAAYMHRHGMDVHADHFAHDIVTTVLLDGDDLETVVDRTSERVDGVRYLGHKKTRHRERRGDRGDPAVRVYFKRPIEPLASAQAVADEHEPLLDVFDFETVTYGPVFEMDESDENPDAVAVTTVECDVLDGISVDEDEAEQLPDLYERHATAFEQDLETETNWKITSVGFVTSTEVDSLCLLALGLETE